MTGIRKHRWLNFISSDKSNVTFEKHPKAFTPIAGHIQNQLILSRDENSPLFYIITCQPSLFSLTQVRDVTHEDEYSVRARLIIIHTAVD